MSTLASNSRNYPSEFLGPRLGANSRPHSSPWRLMFETKRNKIQNYVNPLHDQRSQDGMLHVFIYLSPRSYKYPTGEARKCE